MKRIIPFLLLSLFILLAALPAISVASDTTENKKAKNDSVTTRTSGPLSPPDTSSPQATLRSFLVNTTRAYQLMKQAYALDMESSNIFTHTDKVRALSDRAMLYFEKAIHCIDFSKIPESYRLEYSYEAAIQLKEILDRIKLPKFQDLPADEGQTELDYWRIPSTPFEVQFIKDGDRSGEYLFNQETACNIEKIYERAKNLPYITKTTEGFYRFYSSTPGRLVPPKWFSFIPDALSNELHYEQTIFQWATFVLSILLFILASRITFKLTRVRRHEKYPVMDEVLRLILPVQLVLSCLFLTYVFEDIINLTGRFLVFSVGALQVIKWLSAAWGIMVFGKVIATSILATPRIDPRGIDASLVTTITNLVSIFLALCILFYGGSTLGIPLIPVVTGFGVIGLAISLAARPTIENVIGGLTLFADKPVRIGDLCMFGETKGRVMHIGLRSTRIRATDRTIISIPNAEFSHLQLINLTRRDKFQIDLDLGLRYETTATQLRWIIVKIYEMLYAHPQVSRKPAMWVRFANFNAYSKDINIRAHLNTTKLKEFYRIQEDLLFRIGEIIEEAGASFAFPSNSIYLLNETAEFVEPAGLAKDIEKWTQEDKFPFPDFPEDRIRKIKNRLKYPPENEADYAQLELTEPKTNKSKGSQKKASEG